MFILKNSFVTHQKISSLINLLINYKNINKRPKDWNEVTYLSKKSYCKGIISSIPNSYIIYIYDSIMK